MRGIAVGDIVYLRSRKADEVAGASILEMLDSGKVFSATLVIVDEDGKDYRVKITKTCDLVRVLLEPANPSPFLLRLLQQPMF